MSEEVKKDDNQMTQLDLVSGYVVGLTKEGQCIFRFVGESPSLVSLLGLHKFVGKKLDTALELQQEGNVSDLKQQVEVINTKLEIILKTLAATKASQNKLIP